MLHDAAVGEQSLGGHGLLTAGDELSQLIGVAEEKHLLALLGGELGEKSLAETALVQVINGQSAAGSHEGRSEALHVVAVTQHGHAALAGSHEGGELLAAVAVLDQNVVSAEHVGGVIGGEVPIPQEAGGGGELLHGKQQGVGLVEVERHSVFLLLSYRASASRMPALRRISSSALVRV